MSQTSTSLPLATAGIALLIGANGALDHDIQWTQAELATGVVASEIIVEAPSMEALDIADFQAFSSPPPADWYAEQW
jgi:hypothetical protein